MNKKIDEAELLFKVHRVKYEGDAWMPAIEDIKSHDITPVWAAGVAYVIIDRYINSVSDDNQIEFYKETVRCLNLMLKDSKGSEYTEKIDMPDCMD